MKTPDTNTYDIPAFPSDFIMGNEVKGSKPYSGISLRDWFAGQALAGQYDEMVSPDENADRAYEIADAMLAARAKGGDT